VLDPVVLVDRLVVTPVVVLPELALEPVVDLPVLVALVVGFTVDVLVG
jgi:hypothetical protein